MSSELLVQRADGLDRAVVDVGHEPRERIEALVGRGVVGGRRIRRGTVSYPCPTVTPGRFPRPLPVSHAPRTVPLRSAARPFREWPDARLESTGRGPMSEEVSTDIRGPHDVVAFLRACEVPTDRPVPDRARPRVHRSRSRQARAVRRRRPQRRRRRAAPSTATSSSRSPRSSWCARSSSPRSSPARPAIPTRDDVEQFVTLRRACADEGVVLLDWIVVNGTPLVLASRPDDPRSRLTAMRAMSAWDDDARGRCRRRARGERRVLLGVRSG